MSPTHSPVAVVILAAGSGTRMKSPQPKVLHSVLGETLLGHVLSAVTAIDSSQVVVVVGHGRDEVVDYLAHTWPDVSTVVQEHQNGTGHAVSVALEANPELAQGTVVVLSGDAPLITTEDISALVSAAQGNGAAVLTATVSDPHGYGRIVRNDDGSVCCIVEEKDATPEQRTISEVNSGAYAFNGAVLHSALGALKAHNAQGELYLTDVIEIAQTSGHSVSATVTVEANILGVNDRRQLAHAGAVLRTRINDAHMVAGVTIVDPTTTWIDRKVTIESDATILPNVQLLGRTHLAAGSVIGPDSTLHDTTVLAGAHVVRTTAYEAVIGVNASVGPYTYLRPGTILGEGSKAGGFVEMKNAQLGADAKVPHLSYVGDATIGEGTNIGAATIFVNYDGVEKHHTTIGKQVRIGSDTMLIAPVTVGDGAYTAAGSVITDDVPAGSMGVGRARQRNIVDWVLRRRPGSKSALAALADSSQTGKEGA